MSGTIGGGRKPAGVRLAGAGALLAVAFLMMVGTAWGETSTTICVPEKVGKPIVSGTSLGGCTKNKYNPVKLPGPAGLATLEQILPHITFTAADGPNILEFHNTDVQIVSGTGSECSLNEEGNLIVGYNENPGAQTGSNNIVIGSSGQEFTSCGGILGGEHNGVTAPFASDTAGHDNLASGEFASISGGEAGTAQARGSSVTGGLSNLANEVDASASGGFQNTAEGLDSSVSGGQDNFAAGQGSSVSGGINSSAFGVFSSISGGGNNNADGIWASVTGGEHNEASGRGASVSGGGENVASGKRASIFGGHEQTAATEYEALP